MDRSTLLRRLTALALACVMLIPSTGCVNALVGALWVIKGTNVDARYEGLKGKRVAVVCHPPARLGYSTATVARQLATEIGNLLKQNVSKIDVVDPRDIAKWTDNSGQDDAIEIGEAVNADMVLSIDLEDFKLYEGQTLYRGKANVVIKVIDLENNNEVVFEDIPPQSIYPVNTGVPTTDKQESYFQREFIKVVAAEIGRNFYAHDSREYFAGDSTAFQ